MHSFFNDNLFCKNNFYTLNHFQKYESILNKRTYENKK
jgi:hypothetical protein